MTRRDFLKAVGAIAACGVAYAASSDERGFTVVRDKRIIGKRVVVSDTRFFANCVFEDCEIVGDGGVVHGCAIYRGRIAGSRTLFHSCVIDSVGGSL